MESHATQLICAHHQICSGGGGGLGVSRLMRVRVHTLAICCSCCSCCVRARRNIHVCASKVCLLSRWQRCISACIKACVIVRACPCVVCMHGCSPLPPACSDPLSHGLCSENTRGGKWSHLTSSGFFLTFPPAREKRCSPGCCLEVVSKVIISFFFLIGICLPHPAKEDSGSTLRQFMPS